MKNGPSVRPVGLKEDSWCGSATAKVRNYCGPSVEMQRCHDKEQLVLWYRRQISLASWQLSITPSPCLTPESTFPFLQYRDTWAVRHEIYMTSSSNNVTLQLIAP